MNPRPSDTGFDGPPLPDGGTVVGPGPNPGSNCGRAASQLVPRELEQQDGK